jgi:hypothetical protein
MEQDYFMLVWTWLAGFAASGFVDREDIWLVRSERDQLDARSAEDWMIAAFVDAAAKDAGCSTGPSFAL